MSARPRPVTATFPPPPLLSPVHLRPRSRTPSPLNSTASLLSVLNHMSYDSMPSHVVNHTDDESSFSMNKDEYMFVRNNYVENDCLDRIIESKRSMTNVARQNLINENANAAKKRPELSVASSNKGPKRSKSADVRKRNASNVSSDRSEYISSTDEIKNSENEANDNANELSAWEKWIVQKAKEDRVRAEREMEKQRKKTEEEEKLQKEKQEKRQKGEVVVQAWIKEHNLKTKQKIEEESRKSLEQKELEEKKKQSSLEKSKAKYDEWMHKKAEEEAKRKVEMAEKKEKEQLQKENRRKKSEEAFNDWFKKAVTRPRTAPHSYGYTDGKLTGYYDTGAYPMPSYINPVPWQPVEVPKPRTRPKKKQNVKNRRIVTKKYL